jgi:SAM-dependent methyltransferase
MNKIISNKLLKNSLKKIHQIIFSSRKIINFFKNILKFLLIAKFKNQWMYSKNTPHFYDFEEYDLTFDNISDYNALQRGYLTSEIIDKGDLLCDIGCGSGFFTKKFYSFKCNSIDGIDIEETAIDYAKKNNFSQKIQYHNLDIIQNDFPQKNYDVIVLDGTLGHFSQSSSARLLNKISESLNKKGLFVGSESLGSDADDHLQKWNTMQDMKQYLENHFKYVYCKTIEFPIKPFYNQIRKECYWRCANTVLGKDRILKVFK